MPDISVIVPIYNVEEYLARCIDSILDQTFQDMEIILVDDGSTDSSNVICDYYAVKDERIKVIHKPNEGLSCARNDGIKASSAPYIMFVDGDDWVEPTFCEEPFRMAITNDADLVLFSFAKIYKGRQKVQIDTGMPDGILSEDSAIWFNINVWDAAWVGFYKRDLFEEIQYPIGKIYEDTGTSHRLIHSANKVCLLNSCLYNYRVGRPGSITTSANNQKNPDKIEMHIKRILDLYNWGYENYALKEAPSMLVRYGSSDCNQKDLINVINKTRMPDTFSWKQKIMHRVFRCSPVAFDALCIASGRRAKS